MPCYLLGLTPYSFLDLKREDGKLGLEYEKDSGGGDLGTFQGAPGWGWQEDSAVGPPLWGPSVGSNRKERSESPPNLRHLFRSRLN